MDTSPAADNTVEPAAQPGPVSAAADPEHAAKVLCRFIRCRPGRPGNYCNGTGLVTALVNRERVKRLCACIENAVRDAKAAEDARAAVGTAIAKLAADAEYLPPPPPEVRHVPAGAREKLVRLNREIDREGERGSKLQDGLSALTGAAADELARLTLEEAANKRGKVEAEATKMLASAQMEEVRARLAGLRTAVEEATGTLERLENQSGQFGARRMTAEAEVKRAVDARGPEIRASRKRLEDLVYRRRMHLDRWPELGEVAAS